jgi:two-component system, NarL family, invasion response regulator UvrY
MKELLIADDHHVVRKGLIVICQSAFGLGQVDEATDCSEIMMSLKRKQYTHAIFDLVLSDGMTLEILPNVRRLYPNLNILIFSMQPFGMYRAGLERYGITRYLSKAAPERETLRVLQDFFYNNDSAKVHPKAGTIGDAPDISLFDRFTPREKVVLHYLLLGLGSNEIADMLGMKQNTVSTFKKRILEKSDTRNVLELKELVAIQKEVSQSLFK